MQYHVRNKQDNYVLQLVHNESLSELIEILLNNTEQHSTTKSDKQENSFWSELLFSAGMLILASERDYKFK